jgi:hypothetical protein
MKTYNITITSELHYNLKKYTNEKGFKIKTFVDFAIRDAILNKKSITTFEEVISNNYNTSTNQQQHEGKKDE